MADGEPPHWTLASVSITPPSPLRATATQPGSLSWQWKSPEHQATTQPCGAESHGSPNTSNKTARGSPTSINKQRDPDSDAGPS